MNETGRPLSALSAALLALAVLGVPAAEAEKGKDAANIALSQTSVKPDPAVVRPHMDAVENSGEAGPDPAISDPAYLTQLGLIRGHLRVGFELYRAGRVKAAAGHMKHPEDELYASLTNALERRGAPGFHRQLQTLARAVEEMAGAKKVTAAYRDVEAAIARAEKAVANPSPFVMGQVIHKLVRQAATEYDDAVREGKVVLAHEYQDGMGFVHVAETWLTRLEVSGANVTVVNSIRKQMGVIEPAWPSVIPPERVTVEPGALRRAVAQIETATIDLKE